MKANKSLTPRKKKSRRQRTSEDEVELKRFTSPSRYHTLENEDEDESKTWNGILHPIMILFRELGSVITFPIRIIAGQLVSQAATSVILIILLSTGIYWLKSYIGSILTSLIGGLFSSLSPATSLVSNIHPIITTTIPCLILPRRFCGSNTTKTNNNGPSIAQISRTVSDTAKKASDIFESVVKLSTPSDLGLHQSEITELAFAVRWSTELEGKDSLADQLSDLGQLTRDVKDRMIDLNSEGINAFSSIAHEFSRINDLIRLTQSGTRGYDSKLVAKNLDILFDHLSDELSKLLNSVDRSIPIASRSSHLGSRISESLHQEHAKLIKLKHQQPLWRKLLDPISRSSQQLSRDLGLTSESIRNLRLTWIRLEDMRTDLLNYRNNIGYFKAAVSGWHLADHGLTAEDELYTMRYIIQDFQTTIAKVKTESRYSTKNILPSDQSHDPFVGPQNLENMGQPQ